MSQELKRIFIVDDDPVVSRIIRMGLESAGFGVESANNAAEFLQRLPQEAPDFLITDIEMPEMSGKELCYAIERQIPERRSSLSSGQIGATLLASLCEFLISNAKQNDLSNALSLCERAAVEHAAVISGLDKELRRMAA